MLAGAAAKPGGANAAAVAAMQGQGLEHLWNMNGAGLQASASGLDLSKLTSEQQQHILHNEAAYLVRCFCCLACGSAARCPLPLPAHARVRSWGVRAAAARG